MNETPNTSLQRTSPLQAAQALAAERGVSHRCRFEQGDIRNLLGQEEQYDVALLLSVGPVLGDYEQTISGLRRLVRAGGYDLIRQRASLVRASHPAFEQLIDEYVARQERETQILGTDVLCAIWVLRRA